MFGIGIIRIVSEGERQNKQKMTNCVAVSTAMVILLFIDIHVRKRVNITAILYYCVMSRVKNTHISIKCVYNACVSSTRHYFNQCFRHSAIIQHTYIWSGTASGSKVNLLLFGQWTEFDSRQEFSSLRNQGQVWTTPKPPTQIAPPPLRPGVKQLNTHRER
jgi:hypothetical protein